ncbi:hypothetical protein [Catenuloplanes japonicus]|uniref:hypothetical protein n=1 Tax=Catenuloplanes japonicus TaxID=33876 RepID=UPI000526E066|nr:hypothetical protein [Catenuloplanes japonicus]
MTLPIIPRSMDAICLDHVVPTATGSHIVNAAPSSLATDGLLGEALALPAVPGYTNVSFGRGMRDAFALTDQYLRGIPPEAMDRIVERPLAGTPMSLDELAARADLMRLPVEIPVARLRATPATAIDLHRVLHFDAQGRLTARDGAAIVRVVPAEPRTPDPYATTAPDVRAAALRGGYPSARIVPVEEDRVQLGLPPALVAHTHGDALQGARPLHVSDLPSAPVSVASYGDLLAHIAAGPAAHALVEVRTAVPSGSDVRTAVPSGFEARTPAVSGSDVRTPAVSGSEARAASTTGANVRVPGTTEPEVFLAVHDAAGVAFLDPGTGRAALFPAAPDLIRVAALPGEMTVAERLLDLSAGGVATLPIQRPAGVVAHRTFGPSGLRAVDVLGPVPPKIVNVVSSAAEAIGQSVIVVGPQPRTGPSRRDLLRAEKMLFQHLQNGPAPIVLDYGGAGPKLADIARRWGAPVMRQSLGGGLDLARAWTGAGPDGSVAGPPFTEINADTLKAIGDRQRVPASVRTDPKLAAYLAMTLEDPAAVREALADAGTLKTLRAGIDALPADPQLFAAHTALLDLADRQSPLLDVAIDYLGETRGGQVSTLPAVHTVLNLEPEARSGALDDLKSITMGTLDDGAGRAILDAIQLRLNGAEAAAVERAVHAHSVYLPHGGRADFIRRLGAWKREMPEHGAVFDEVAVYVTTCP